MKSNKIYNKAAKVFALIPFTLCLLLLLASCSNDNLSDLQLAGNCAVESIELDGKYTGVVDPVSRTVKIKVPVSFLNKSAMKVTALNISEGATANIAVGDVVDFSAAKVMHITRGDLYLDWTINVKNDEAKIKSFIINDTYKASINEEEHTITAFLPATVDIKKAIPTITYSEDATISPLSGGTSQPCTESLNFALQGTEYDPKLNVEMLNAAAAKLHSNTIIPTALVRQTVGIKPFGGCDVKGINKN